MYTSAYLSEICSSSSLYRNRAQLFSNNEITISRLPQPLGNMIFSIGVSSIRSSVRSFPAYTRERLVYIPRNTGVNSVIPSDIWISLISPT